MDTIVCIVRWAGGVAALGMMVVIMISVGRFRSRPAGKTVGSSPARLYSPIFLGFAALISIAVGILLWRPIVDTIPAWAQVTALLLGTLLYFPGIGLILWGRLALGKFHNLSSSQGVQLFADHQLITSGPFAYVRHPMYLGFWMAALGGLLLYGTWTMVILLLGSPIFVRRARLEEEALIAVFGEDYLAYQRRVPAFFPHLIKRDADITRR
jgi:protein-S-isoprenylcysteine O-methyltransferase Ste14